MSNNHVIIIERPTYIHVKNECLLFEQKGKVLQRILPEDIDCLILHYTTTITASALAALATSRVIVVLLDKKQLPLATWQPPKTNHRSKQRLVNLIQLSASPLGKRLWQKVVQAKIKSQADTLDLFHGKSAKLLCNLSSQVIIGDSNNVESHAARVYWQELFGAQFRRSKQNTNDPINQHLNFGYGIVRSLIAKWLCARSINLEWGFHHHNKENPMCLVDDLIEPFRFMVDRAVASNLTLCKQEICAHSKRTILENIYQPLEIGGKNLRLASAIEICSSSFGKILDTPSKANVSWLMIPYM